MMRKIIILLFLGFAVGVYANENEKEWQDVKVGDTFIISEASAHEYQHLQFPKRNIILKKGGTPDYKSVEGNRVQVTEITTEADGDVIVTLERTDGTKFYNRYKTVKANISDAVSSGELVE
ncbi:hypothetical protein SAMN04487906_1519 [Zhouia amylolytica]|uniref:Uncharacterized protein n=2 Tax=Zhouia amylolytica TaxID=376730 RepID=W2UL82_9FLAO|nr:hypothetical protein [Zhouia amylolytica]ETN94739.1 hypothetical protein P278_26820 [Zhouia amylolytica AD3]SFS74440.1 hypothetical protein SAMN04487906_1519 [Zhouia amylolytica]